MAVDTKIPGLTVEFIKIGAHLWAKVCHKDSDFFVARFQNEPLPFGKREFIKRLDASCINSVDWTQSAEKLRTEENFDIVSKARIEILKG